MEIDMQNYMPLFKGIYENQTIECYSFNQNKNLSIGGVLNFFLNNDIIKEISIIPWKKKKKNKNYNQEDIKKIETFNLKKTNIKINGFYFDYNI